MDPALVLGAVTVALGYLVRLLLRWIRERGAVRRAELAQSGLSDRVRLLPAGSRLVEKDRERQVEIMVGFADNPSEAR
ncbi:hypothetical protein [Streptomyces virginiae]|uniref:hypothetical protein n=1 Tax=Streptomyces virginiae TaxID=1961 RepID=UPI002F919BBD